MISLVSKNLQLRTLDITHKKKLSHLSSTLPAVNILDYIYSKKLPQDKVVVSNGHCGLALYCVLEKFYNKDAEALLEKHGIHPNRDLSDEIFCSTGSLGLGLPIAVGLALGADYNVHCTISDGESCEGSIWESLRFVEDNKISNLKIHVQVNGYGAYSEFNSKKLHKRMKSFCSSVIWHETDTNFFNDVDPYKYHYKSLDDHDYNELRKKINEGNIKTITTF
jgi:transketolase